MSNIESNAQMASMSDTELADFIRAQPSTLTSAQSEALGRRLDRVNRRLERGDFLVEAAWLMHDYLKARAEAKGVPLDYDLFEDWRASEDRLVSSLQDSPNDEVLGVTIEVKRKYIYLTDTQQPSEGFLQQWLPTRAFTGPRSRHHGRSPIYWAASGTTTEAARTTGFSVITGF